MKNETKVVANKENAKKALRLVAEYSRGGENLSGHLNFLKEFLEAAVKRLPSQKAIDADKAAKAQARKAAKEAAK